MKISKKEKEKDYKIYRKKIIKTPEYFLCNEENLNYFIPKLSNRSNISKNTILFAEEYLDCLKETEKNKFEIIKENGFEYIINKESNNLAIIFYLILFLIIKIFTILIYIIKKYNLIIHYLCEENNLKKPNIVFYYSLKDKEFI